MTDFAQFDLHLHSQWSYDAYTTVEDYFKLARERKVRAFALTDHHTMDGYGDMLEIAPRYPDVHFIPGAELTVHSPLGTFDMVCLGMPCTETPELAGLFETYRVWQRACGSAISANLVRMGFAFDDSERMKVLQSYRPQRIIDKQGCTHVRSGTMIQAVLQRGIAKDLDDWKRIRSQFVDIPHYPEYDYVLPIVRKAGGIVIIAHPYGYFKQFDTDRMDALREMLQFDGIECAHPSVPPEATAFYRSYCEKYGLLSSGGSDCHSNEPTFEEPGHQVVDFAHHIGNPKWLDEILERVSLH